MQKVKVLLLISILLAVLVGCKQTSRSRTPKLNDEQQALANTFFNNREQWEYYDDLYCTGLKMYNSQDAVTIYCEYSSSPLARTNEAVSSHVLLKTYCFKVTKEKVEFNGQISNSVLVPGMILNSNTNVSAPDGGSSYYYREDYTSKQELINTLFSKYKSKE